MNYYHSVPYYVLRGHDYNISVVLKNTTDDVYVTIYAGVREHRLKLSKLNNVNTNSANLCAYGATVPASFYKNADILRYRFLSGDVQSKEYCVNIAGAGKMPPLAITEIYLRPKGLNVTKFFEIVNPSDYKVDLYDYKIMAYNGMNPCAKDYVCSLNLSPKAGKEVLKHGEVAVIWPLLPKNHMLDSSGKYTQVDGFIDACMSDMPGPAFDMRDQREKLRIIPVEASQFDSVSGEYKAVEKADKFPDKEKATTLLIAPVAATPQTGITTSVFSLVYNRFAKESRDVPVRRSSLWTIDVRNPQRGVLVKHRADITPGLLDRGQTVPDLNTVYPVIVPQTFDLSADKNTDFLTLKFLAAHPHLTDVYICLKTANGTFRKYDAEDSGNGLWSVQLPFDEIYDLSEIDYYICVNDGIRVTKLGCEEDLLHCSIADFRGPYITDFFPKQLYGYDDTRTPEISVSYSDISGVDTTKSILCVDSRNVSDKACWTKQRVVYMPSRQLRYGKHSYEVMLIDGLGNKTYRKVEFLICKPDSLNLYHGEVHSHTACSDGTAGPVEAYSYARDVGKVDFFSVTEHSNYIDEQIYRDQIKIANRFDDPGHFAALYGFEMTWNNTTALWGHSNILNSDWIMCDICENGMPELLDKLSSDKKAIGMFNHPGLSWGNFHDYKNYTTRADKAICLAEIKGASYDREYMDMLALGWHVSPAFNEDNHADNWTTATDSTTYVLAPSLTRDNILDAFRRRRTYSTADQTMKIHYKVNGQWMGSVLNNPTHLVVDVDIKTSDENGIGTVYLIAEDNITVASVNVGALKEYSWKLKLDPDFDYYYVKIISSGKYTVTAPVWVEGRDEICIKKLAYEQSNDEYRPHAVVAKIKNQSATDIRALEVRFYLTPATGFDINNTVPYWSVTVPILKHGMTANVKCKIPDIPGLRRVSVIAKGSVIRSNYADTSMVLVSPLKISEIMPKTSPGEDANGIKFSNPFPYFKIRNMSNRDITLNNYYTRLWVKTGKTPPESRMLHLYGVTVEKRATLTVWMKPVDSAFTADDFNRHYDINLIEDKDLFITSVRAISGSADTRRLELMFKNETLSRAEYNFTQKHGADIHADKAITFDVMPNLTGTSEIISNCSDPDF